MDEQDLKNIFQIIMFIKFLLETIKDDAWTDIFRSFKTTIDCGF